MDRQNQSTPDFQAHGIQKALCRTTPRLEALYQLACRYSSIADIGCDHAYLPILLAQRNPTCHIIAADVREGPLKKATANVMRFGLSDRIELRLGNGLSCLKKGEADAIVMAGMGGTLIAELLDAQAELARSASALILQPMSSSYDLRKYLYLNGYSIVEEQLILEGVKWYCVMLVVHSCKTQSFNEFDCYISPAMKKNEPELFRRYFNKRFAEINKIVTQLSASRDATSFAYYLALQKSFQAYENENLKGRYK